MAALNYGQMLISFALLLIFIQYIDGQSQLNCSRSYPSDGGRGIIESHNFPFNYRDAQTCQYTVFLRDRTDDVAKQVCFTFRRFDMDDGHDFLNIRTGDYFCQYTGQGKNSPVKSSCPEYIWPENLCFPVNGGNITLELVTDADVTGRGFLTNYTVTQQGGGTEQPKIGESRPAPQQILHKADPPAPYQDGDLPCFTTSRKWTCFNRDCVFVEDVCNMVDDCGDDSDESYAHARCTGLAHGSPNVEACDFQDRSSCHFDGIGFGWVIDGGSSSPGRGPTTDHTIGRRGEGAYTRTRFWSAGAVPDVTLFDLSYYFDPQLDACLSFFYHMMGRDVGRLQVDIQYQGASLVNSVWSRVGNYSDRWHRAEVPVTRGALLRFAYAKFTATRAGDFYTQIALDDFSISDGACRGEDISCNFELGLCSWEATAGLQRSRDYGSEFGPNDDTSSQDGGGYYLMRQTSTAGLNDTLTSPYVTVLTPASRAACLVFWHYLRPHIYDHKPMARILKQYYNGSVAVFHMMMSQRGYWSQWVLDIADDSPFRLVFEWVSPAFDRVIAIDQIMLIEGPCNLLDLKSCDPLEYRCGTGNCIPISKACDGVKDCVDGADEEPEACCTLSACPEGKFCCRNKNCIDADWECDGDNDCGDWSDEDHCLARAPCPVDRFLCMDNTRCISERYKCNGEKDCADGSDEQGCGGNMPYVSPAVLAVVVVLGVILIVLVFVKLGLAIRSGQCSVRDGCRRSAQREEDEEAGPAPFTLNQYQLPPDYSDAVSNPVYLPTLTTSPIAGEKEDEESKPPAYDRVIRGEFVQLQSTSQRDIDLLRERMKSSALHGTREGYDNTGYVSDSELTLAPAATCRRQVSLDPGNMNLSGNGDIVGVTDLHYILPPGDEQGPPPYVARLPSRQASIRRSLRRSLRRSSHRAHQPADASPPSVPSEALTASSLLKLESIMLRAGLHVRSGVRPYGAARPAQRPATTIDFTPELLTHRDRAASSEA